MTSDIIAGRRKIAERLGCSEKTVTRLFHSKKLRGAFKFGPTSQLRIAESSLKRLIKERR